MQLSGWSYKGGSNQVRGDSPGDPLYDHAMTLQGARTTSSRNRSEPELQWGPTFVNLNVRGGGGEMAGVAETFHRHVTAGGNAM